MSAPDNDEGRPGKGGPVEIPEEDDAQGSADVNGSAVMAWRIARAAEKHAEKDAEVTS